MKEIKLGVSAEKTIDVTQERTAAAMGSGSLAVFATPGMVALMEEATCLAAAPYLEGDETTVGTAIAIKHTAPTPVGGKVTAHAVLEKIDGRKLTFQVSARDNKELIGAGTITRFLVNGARFQAKADSK